MRNLLPSSCTISSVEPVVTRKRSQEAFREASSSESRSLLGTQHGCGLGLSDMTVFNVLDDCLGLKLVYVVFEKPLLPLTVQQGCNLFLHLVQAANSFWFAIMHPRDVKAERRTKDIAGFAYFQGKYHAIEFLDHITSREIAEIPAVAGA